MKQKNIKSEDFDGKLLEINDKLFRYAMSLTKDKSEAEDLLQETNYKALKNREKFKQGTNQVAWTYTIMRNTFINNYRKGSKIVSKHSYTDDMSGQTNIDWSRDSKSTDSFAEENEIYKVINSMKDKYKSPFLMHVQGYKYKEIAKKFDIHIGTVKSRIFLGRQKLMHALKEAV